MKWKLISILAALALLVGAGMSEAGAVRPVQVALAAPPAVYQCGCGEFYPRPNDAILDAGAVFTGEVVSVTDLSQEEADALRGKRIVFRVISSWKSAARPEIMVDTGPLADGCGLEFRPGEIWVVYMDTSRLADKCTRTRPLEEAGEDLAQLGRGNPPLSDELVARVKPVESVERLRGLNLYGRLGIAALILATCLGGPLIYYRRKGQAASTG